MNKLSSEILVNEERIEEMQNSYPEHPHELEIMELTNEKHHLDVNLKEHELTIEVNLFRNPKLILCYFHLYICILLQDLLM